MATHVAVNLIPKKSRWFYSDIQLGKLQLKAWLRRPEEPAGCVDIPLVTKSLVAFAPEQLNLALTLTDPKDWTEEEHKLLFLHCSIYGPRFNIVHDRHQLVYPNRDITELKERYFQTSAALVGQEYDQLTTTLRSEGPAAHAKLLSTVSDRSRHPLIKYKFDIAQERLYRQQLREDKDLFRLVDSHLKSVELMETVAAKVKREPNRIDIPQTTYSAFLAQIKSIISTKLNQVVREQGSTNYKSGVLLCSSIINAVNTSMIDNFANMIEMASKVYNLSHAPKVSSTELLIPTIDLYTTLATLVSLKTRLHQINDQKAMWSQKLALLDRDHSSS